MDMVDEDIPIDIIENMRGRSTKDHVSDEAVGREIERRWTVFNMQLEIRLTLWKP